MLGGHICLISWNITRPHPVRLALLWNCAFVLTHGVQLVFLYLERRKHDFSREESDLYNMGFKETGISPGQFVQVLNKGEWATFDGGSVLFHEGQPHDDLYLLHSGTMTALSDGITLGRCLPGDFVGEMAYLRSDTSNANATVVW